MPFSAFLYLCNLILKIKVSNWPDNLNYNTTNNMNTYVPKFVPDNLPWYERDGLITWYDQQKCEDFLRDNDKHFKETKIIKFNIIYRETCGEVVPPNFFKFYQTVNEKTISQYPSSKQDNICSSALF